MANPKLKKVTGDITKTKDKIADLQIKLRELEQQKTELENTEILALFRSVSVTPEELTGFIRRYKAESVAKAAAEVTMREEQEDIANDEQ